MYVDCPVCGALPNPVTTVSSADWTVYGTFKLRHRWKFGMGNRWFYSNETYVVYQSSASAVTVPAGPGTRVPAAPADVNAAPIAAIATVRHYQRVSGIWAHPFSEQV